MPAGQQRNQHVIDQLPVSDDHAAHLLADAIERAGELFWRHLAPLADGSSFRLFNSPTLQLSNWSFKLRQPLKVSPHKRPVLRRNVRALEGAVHAGHQRGGHCLRERPRGSGPAGADHLRGAHLTLTLDAADPLGRPLSLEARSGRAEPVVDAPRARGRAFTRALRRRGLRAWLRGDLSPTRTRRLLRLIRRGLTLFAGSPAPG